MKTRLSILLSLTLGVQGAFSQVARTVVVEHFTNTVCSVCASRNPGFYTNLDGQSGVIHLAVHPSSPYSSCLFSQHNPSENDARTNYYGIYGATPRIVIQGDVIPAATNYGDPSIFTPYLSQTSPASVYFSKLEHQGDSVEVEVVVKTEATHSLGALRLFFALAEDTIFYNSPNGESEHYDVFRKSVGAVSGEAMTLPAAVADSVVLSGKVYAHPDWDLERIFPIAILQEEATLDVVQSAKGDNLVPSTAGIGPQPEWDMTLYPNPTSGSVNIDFPEFVSGQVVIFNSLGEKQMSMPLRREIDLAELTAGTYILQIVSDSEVRTMRFVKN